MNDLIFLAGASATTLALALCALVLGLILAMLFAVWEMSRSRSVALAGTTLVTMLRGLPEILVVLSVYYGSSQLFLSLSDGISINLYFYQFKLQLVLDTLELSPFLCGVIALALLYSAYASQTLRGALKAVPHGQREAGLALGLTRRALFFRIIMPQMWRHALPGLGNQWLVLLKDTALVSLITVNDLMAQSKSIAIRTQEPFTWYLIAALIYLLMTLLSQQLLKWLELRMTRFERGTT